MRSPAFQDYLCDTIYLGGGTPSSLSENQLAEVMDNIRRRFHISDHPEITTTSPSLTPALWVTMRSANWSMSTTGATGASAVVAACAAGSVPALAAGSCAGGVQAASNTAQASDDGIRIRAFIARSKASRSFNGASGATSRTPGSGHRSSGGLGWHAPCR